MTEPNPGRLAAERDRLDPGPLRRSAWRRLCPCDPWADPLLGELEAALDAPELARELDACEAEERYPQEAMAELRRLGLARVMAEREGSPDSLLTAYHQGAVNAITARRSASLAITSGVHFLALLPAYVAATPEQLERIFARLEEGAGCALLLSELPHGSNLLRNEMRAEPGTLDDDGAFRPRTGDEPATCYRLTGEKDLINGGREHDLLFTLVRTGGPCAPDAPFFERMAGFSMLWVERGDGAVGLPRWRTQPAQAADISGVAFPGVVVPADRVLAAEGAGFRVIKQTLAVSRGGISALASGTLSRARDVARSYAARRDVYGAPIEELGAVAGHLLRLEALDRAAAALSLKAVAAVNAAGTGAAYYTCLAKLGTCSLAEEGVAEGRQVLGARALLRDLPYERLTRDVLLYGVFDGTSHVMREEVARWLDDEVGRWSGRRARRVADPLAEAARIYGTPPVRALEVLRRRRTRPLVLPLPEHLRGLAAASREVAAAPLPDAAEALYAVVQALDAAERWRDDQEVRFAAAEALAELETSAALTELADPGVREALGLPPIAPLDSARERALEAAAVPYAVAWLAARAVARVRRLAAEGGLATGWLPERVAAAGGLEGLEGRLWWGQGERRRAFAAGLAESSDPPPQGSGTGAAPVA